MKAWQRILVAGPFGGLVALGAATTGAFACTANATVTVVTPTAYFHPGDPIQIGGGKFYDPVRDSLRGDVIGDIVVTLRYPGGAKEVLIGTAQGPSFTLPTFTIPADTPSNDNDPYIIVATQTLNGSSDPKTATIMISNGPRALPATTTTSTPNGPATTAVLPTTVTIPGQAPLGTVPFSRGTGPAVAPRTPPAGPAGAPPGVAAPGSPAVSPGTTRPGVPATSPGAPGEVALPDRQPFPLAADLWSAVDPDHRPSLVDRAPPPPRDTPVGGILLVTGSLALAGVALAEGRRDLVRRRAAHR